MAREEYFTSVEKDAQAKAVQTLLKIKKDRGGKFKLSERQFMDVIETIWIGAEMSGAERVLRAIESDDDLDTKDNIRAALHIFVLDLLKILKKRIGLKMTVTLEDIIWGKYSTANIFKNKENTCPETQQKN